METQPQKPTPILEIAWLRHAQLDAIASKRSRQFLSLRRWIAILGVLAALFAVLSQILPFETSGLLGVIVRGILILLPILASGLAAYTSSFFSNGDWLIARAGAEEIKKEVFNYRTILRDSPTKRVWLENRLVEIQRSVFRGMGGELTMEEYNGPLPVHHDPKKPDSDPGFHDLAMDEYFIYRVKDQLLWHSKKVVQRQAERKRLQLLILVSGGLGAFMAVILPLWVALTASLTAALIGWQELRNLDAVIKNYSKVRMELGIIHDHWRNLTTEEKTQSEFFNMVKSTEDILWSQNVEYIKAMQEALKENDLSEEASLINRTIQEARDSDKRLKKSMEDSIVEFTHEKLTESEKVLEENFDKALNSLAEEASSELVQAELAAMQQMIQESFTSVKDKLQEIAEEFAGVEISRDTPPSVLNNLLSKYPKSSDAKG
ncbi:MAG: SLATT domain-containing protein [Anaerolineales bacterium]